MGKKLAFFLVIFSLFCSLQGACLSLPDQFDVTNRYYMKFLMDIKDTQSNYLGTIDYERKPITTYLLKNTEKAVIAQAILKECSISRYIDSQGATHFSRVCSFFDIVDMEGYPLGSVKECWPGKYEFFNEASEIVAKSQKIDSFWKTSSEIRDLENNLIATIHSSFYSSHVEVNDRDAFEKIAMHVLLIPIGFYFHNPVHPLDLNCSYLNDTLIFETPS